MGTRRIRLARESTLELPQLRDASNQPLAFRPNSTLAIVSDDVANHELVQNYLAQGLLVEVDEKGNILPPPAAPPLKSDAERGVGPQRGARGAGANPEDGTAPRPGNAASPRGAGLPETRQARGAGANPEDGTAPSPGGFINPNTQQVQRSSPNQQNAPKNQGNAPQPPSAISMTSPSSQGAQAEGAYQQNMATPNAPPEAAGDLASRRDTGSVEPENADTRNAFAKKHKR